MAERGAVIVIPVLDEAANIASLLDDCTAQSHPADEIVIVDAGSRDGTRELLEQRRHRWPALVVVLEDGATPGRGRNVGIRHTRGAVIATLDAGSRVGPCWLEELLRVREAGGPQRLTTGVTEADPWSPFEEAAGWFTLHGFKPPNRKAPLAREFLPAGRNGYCFMRSLWEAAGGYPEDLPWGEDKVFLRRVVALGTEIAVAPEAVVRWRPRRSLAEIYRQYERYGRGDALGRVDRQNELVTFVVYGAGGVLLALALRGRRAAAVALAVAATAYLSLFVVPALLALGRGRAVMWVPVIRLAVDVAKMRGFVGGSLTACLAGRR